MCLKHGGIDWTATNAALKARGQSPIQPERQRLKAKPGVQTGPADTSSMGQMKDTSSTSR